MVTAFAGKQWRPSIALQEIRITMPNGARVLQSGQIVGESGRNACGSFAGIGEVDPGITQRAEPIQRRDVTAGFLEIASVGGQQDRVRSAERRGVVEGVEQVMTQPDRQVHGGLVGRGIFDGLPLDESQIREIVTSGLGLLTGKDRSDLREEVRRLPQSEPVGIDTREQGKGWLDVRFAFPFAEKPFECDACVDNQVHGRPSCLAAAISDSDRIGCLGPTVQNPANGLVALPLAPGAFDGLSHQLGDDGVLVLTCICGVEGVFHFVGNLELHSGHVRCSFVLRITYVGLGFAARTASRRCVAPPARSGPRR
jgi:hypothetical protein